jgi:hypothetical protein
MYLLSFYAIGAVYKRQCTEMRKCRVWRAKDYYQNTTPVVPEPDRILSRRRPPAIVCKRKPTRRHVVLREDSNEPGSQK